MRWRICSLRGHGQGAYWSIGIMRAIGGLWARFSTGGYDLTRDLNGRKRVFRVIRYPGVVHLALPGCCLSFGTRCCGL